MVLVDYMLLLVLIHQQKTLDYILKNRNWKKLDKSQVKNEDKIGFVFSNIDKKSTLKSQINFRVQTQNSEIFTDKVVFKEYFKNKWFLFCKSRFFSIKK